MGSEKATDEYNLRNSGVYISKGPLKGDVLVAQGSVQSPQPLPLACVIHSA